MVGWTSKDTFASAKQWIGCGMWLRGTWDQNQVPNSFNLWYGPCMKLDSGLSAILTKTPDPILHFISPWKGPTADTKWIWGCAFSICHLKTFILWLKIPKRNPQVNKCVNCNADSLLERSSSLVAAYKVIKKGTFVTDAANPFSLFP